MAPLHPRTSTWLSLALACSITLVIGCPGSEIRERVEAEVDRPAVRFTAPLQNALFDAISGAANIPSEIYALLPSGASAIEMSLDGTRLTSLSAGDVAAGDVGQRIFTYTYGQVGIGLHTLKVQALDAEGVPYKNTEAVDFVDVFVITACDADADCDDDNICSTDRCLSGFCTYTKLNTPGCLDPNAPDGAGGDADVPPIQFPCKETKDCENYPAFQNLGGCAQAFCDDLISECRIIDIQDGTPCEDGNLCTGGDRCDAGTCLAGEAVACDDQDLCTDDTCDPVSGCLFTYNPETCPCSDDSLCPDDGDPCNGELRCVDFQCVTDPATVPSCGEQQGCFIGVCNSETGGCDLVPAPDDSPCDDGNLCTDGDICVAGNCAGTPTGCDDGNLCTDDACDPAAGCSNIPVPGLPCEDNNNCTLVDTCDANGACVGSQPLDCNDQNLCTVDSCDAVVGCVFDAGPVNGAPCFDDDECTGPGTCFEGVCVVPLIPCNDGNPCTDDSCDADAGCVFTNNTAPCNDGDPCTNGDVCAGGACAPGVTVVCDDANPCTQDTCNPTGGCTSTPLSGNPCDDGNICTQTDVCVAGSCQGSNPLTCDDGNPCTTNTCDPVQGCMTSNAPNGTPCDDGSPCTNNDVCTAGVCQGVGLICNDNNPCTTDTCTLADGCIFTPTAGPCSDGNACTANDVCVAGSCAPGTPVNCDDGNVCTSDTCNPSTGCANAPTIGACDDGSVCTQNDQCVNGACTGQPISCNDENECTDDICNPSTGCTNPPNSAPCDDGDFCTINDTCSGGACSDSDPNPACQNIICEVSGDVGEEVVCPMSMIRVNQFVPIPAALQFTMNFDNLALTLARFQDEICIAPGVCLTLNIPVDAPLISTGHQLSIEPPITTAWAGTGSAILVNLSAPNVPISPAYLSNDGSVVDDPIFMDAVFLLKAQLPPGQPSYVTLPEVIVSSAAAEALPAYVQDLTIYVDGEAQCVPQLCNDGNPCTLDTCDALGQDCLFVPQSGTPCDDGNPCTTGDACDTGICVPGGPTNCNDNNVCTADACNPATGCVSTPTNGAACNDGNACTSGDVCTAGACAGTAITCNDNNVCTNDSCNPATGCVFANNTAPCNDNNACTSGDICASGTCSGTAIACNDSNPCTNDSCNPASGCVFVNNTQPCNDGNACTQNDICAGGACSGSPVTCNDGNVCTNDSCNPASGCVFANNAATCNDGNACTTNDTCAAGACAGVPASCDDGDPCTLDTCDPSTGCSSAPAALPCDDGDFCTIDDTCTLQGNCVGLNPNPMCENTACKITGLAGQEVICPLKLARVNSQVPLPVALQFNLDYDDTSVTLERFQDEICFAPGLCQDLEVPPALLSTGHQVSIFPVTASMWAGNGTFLAVNLSDPTAGVTEAYLDGGGAMQMDPVYAEAVFTLMTDIDPATPALLTYSAIVVSKADAEPMDYFVADDTIFVDADFTCDPTQCNDNNPCTIDGCDSDTDACIFQPTTGGACSDGNACTTGDACANGTCTGAALVCSDGNACNGVESCNPATGCVAGVALNCDDSNACTTDSCSPTTGCTTTAVNCNDGVACTVDSCNPATGCANVATNSLCDDANLCNGTETCNATTGCVAGTALSCNDNNACTTDSCNPSTGCSNVALNCNDGIACTTDSCNPATGCSNVANNAACNDSNACNGIETCNAATGCVPGTAPSCNDNNACTTDSCNPASGCVNAPISCNDGIACTTDSCNPASGCVNTANNAACGDGDACNGTETCNPATGCVPGTPVSCNDGNLCNGAESCNPATGACVPGTALNCNDNSACTTDSCNPATGCANVAVGCNDGIACTIDTCSDATGCVHTPNNAACGDNNACNGSETCNPATGCVAGTPVNCNDGNVCNGTETCNPTTGGCIPGTALTCNDGNVCNGTETCNPASGCQNGAPLNCSDGVACTVDTCNPTAGCSNAPNNAACNDNNVCNGAETCNATTGCVAGTALDCDDADACTNDSCSATAGCVNVPATCNDGIACTNDSCNPATGCVFTPVNSSCNDGNACTVDACNPATGCVTTPTNCDDGDACTIDTCTPATGCAHATVECDDEDICTDDFCDPATGSCATSFNTAPCDDEDFCTINDACLNGTCSDADPNPSCANAVCEVSGQAGDEVLCPLQLARLTIDTPIPAGVQFNVVFNGLELDAQRYTDFIIIPGVGQIEAQVPPQLLSTGHQVTNFPMSLLTWNDNPGMPNTKVTATGSTLIANLSNPNAAVSPAYLDASGNVQDDPLFMNLYVKLLVDIDPVSPSLIYLDKIVGTTAAAEPMDGVVSNKIIIVYTEEPCVTDDDCDDGNPCTTQTCNAATGLCVHSPNDGASCDDGDPCSTNDTCAAGACLGTGSLCDDGNPCTNDLCNPVSGQCDNQPQSGAACNDGNACTTNDTCQSGSCVGQGTNCNDGNPCTDDVCVGGACTFVNNNAPCTDANLCTQNDTCSGGTCVGGAPVVCTDNTICDGINVCNPATGQCVPDFTNIPFCGDGILTPECLEQCDDGNNLPADGCGPSCLTEACVVNADCNDNNVCTADVCTPGVGCSNSPVAGPCSDGNACTSNDTCSAGVCVPGAPVVCSDGVACTVDSCNPATGCQHTENDAACNDNQSCTTDVCDGSVGCQHVPLGNGTACNDGSACTTGEVCTGGICGGGAAVNCNDGNPCTSESCNAASGCVYANLTGNACSDLNDCTINDKCDAGVCLPGTYVPNPPICPVLGGDEGVVCELTGFSGQTVECEIHITSAAQGQDFATGLQFTMQFNRKLANLVNFYDYVCFGPGLCFDVPVAGAGAQPLSSGHSLSIAPVQLALWNGIPCNVTTPCANGKACVAGLCEETGGYGAVVIVNLNNPSAVLSSAYLDGGGNVVGASGFVKVRFTLLADAVTPVEVILDNLAAAQKDSLPLTVTVIDQLLVTSP